MTMSRLVTVCAMLCALSAVGCRKGIEQRVDILEQRQGRLQQEFLDRERKEPERIAKAIDERLGRSGGSTSCTPITPSTSSSGTTGTPAAPASPPAPPASPPAPPAPSAASTGWEQWQKDYFKENFENPIAEAKTEREQFRKDLGNLYGAQAMTSGRLNDFINREFKQALDKQAENSQKLLADQLKDYARSKDLTEMEERLLKAINKQKKNK